LGEWPIINTNKTSQDNGRTIPITSNTLTLIPIVDENKEDHRKIESDIYEKL